MRISIMFILNKASVSIDLIIEYIGVRVTFDSGTEA